VQSDIVAKGLVKRFGATAALKGVSMSSRRGVNIVLGPNGAGKSTLLKCMCGLYRPSGGSVSVLGSDPYRDSRSRSRISLLADNYGLYDFMSVADNLYFFGKFYGLNGRDVMDRVGELVGELGLKQYLGAKVEALSRGTKQKAAFCRAMMNGAQVMLLDEPTAFLDANASGIVRRCVQGMAKEGRTIVFVTQRLDEVTRFNSRISVLRGGRLVSETDVEGIYRTIFRDSSVNIRLAQPVGESAMKSLGKAFSASAEGSNIVAVRVKNYRDVNRAIKRIIDAGANVVGVNYAEPELERMVFGDNE
jgi:ABC-type multidrug transport system ATPase subunit